MQVYSEISKCRICGDMGLKPIFDLGQQTLTGVFPKSRTEIVPVGPLALVKCMGGCGLVQLAHNYHLPTLYGDNYGYRSGLNNSMVRHLHAKVARILSLITLKPGDLVIDIGSNDSTLLQAYPKTALLVGVDPTGVKFRQYYPEHIRLIPDFFPSKHLSDAVGDKKAAVITSISMFYDLEDPLSFVRAIHDRLADDGVWVFEQSYMPTMLAMRSYDTVCHEHLEYYALAQIEWMMKKTGMKIIDVEFNAVNGGSFSVTAAKASSSRAVQASVEAAMAAEREKRFDTMEPYTAFADDVVRHRDELLKFFADAKRSGKKVIGYGASTKGNVMLQYCGITEEHISCIAEVNENKFGRVTPGTHIPIVSEADARAQKPDYLMVFPWHFRDSIVERETAYLAAGGHLVFPLPNIEIV